MLKGLQKSLQKNIKMLRKQHFVVQIISFGLIYLALRYVVKDLIWKNIKHNMMEGFDQSRAKSFVFFHWDKCGHCKKMMPEWDKFQNSYSGDIEIKKVERSDNKQMIDDLGITSFPTLLVLDENNGKLAEYSGERKASAFKKFLE